MARKFLCLLYITENDIARLGMWDDVDEAMPGPSDLWADSEKSSILSLRISKSGKQVAAIY